jgi:fatty acid desaturase
MNAATASEPPLAHDEEFDQPHWVARSAFPFLVLAFVINQALLYYALANHLVWLTVIMVLVCCHLMHGFLIGFHEASHGLLRKNRLLNDFDGVLLGTLSFMSFTLYRAAHQTHHMHLGNVKDEELWPFNDPARPRWQRVLAAMLELNLGMFFTPFLFLRVFLRKDSPIRSRKVRRRIWLEIAGMLAFWTVLLSIDAYFGLWKYFLWTFFVPAVIAGNLQSWRKYIEHVGLTGTTVRAGTRSIVSDTFAGRLFAFTLLHEPYHGVHHLHAGLTHAELPSRRASLQPTDPDEFAPFHSYRQALWHLLGCLADPRVGPQWKVAPRPSADIPEARSA